MTSQQEADVALAEHRAVMAAHVRAFVGRPTAEQYEALLAELRGAMARHDNHTAEKLNVEA